MANSNKIKAAITGGIGSGKSLFCKMLEEKGYPVIYADDISKEILATDEIVREMVIEEFGPESFTDKVPNRNYIAEQAFADPGKLYMLNAILHPVVVEKQNELMEQMLKKTDIVFLEAALIYEADLEEMFDYVVLVTANDNIKMQRKIASGLSEEDFRKRADSQIPDSEKMNRADFVFVNNGSKEELLSKAELLITLLKSLQNSTSK